MPRKSVDGRSYDEHLDQLGVVPWKNTQDPEVVPLLVLDAYRLHMMGSIVNHIQALGIGVQHIPAGSTYLCQPLDVGIYRSIKKEMTEQWEEWMMDDK